ncbi:unnamed protein product [marine sediment metagenome]|uniref:Uncharacterized protein n=1 Tax=marine sediment metagenome TaxID=412755 RepID=X1M085_9ZZZZ
MPPTIKVKPVDLAGRKKMRGTRKCFVIMPVSKTCSCTKQEWTSIFNEMIRPAVTGSRLSFTCERAKPRTGSFIRDILNELNTADVVIADLTDMNPNVYYELGVRHTLRNRTILKVSYSALFEIGIAPEVYVTIHY